MQPVSMLSTHGPMEDVMVEVRQLKSGLYVGRALLPHDHQDLKVCVANTTNQRHMISAGTCLGQALPVTAVMDAADNSTPDLPASGSDDNKFTVEVMKSVTYSKSYRPMSLTNNDRKLPVYYRNMVT